MRRKKIAIRACAFDMSGYATISRNIILELYKTNLFDIVVEPLRWINSGNIPLDDEKERILRTLEEKHFSEEYQLNKKDYVLIHFSIAPEFIQTTEYKKYFGYTMLETHTIPNTWVNKCNHLDGVFVPSYHNLGSFMRSGVTVPLRTVPLGIDMDMYTLNNEPLYSGDVITTDFNFILVGQWAYADRKNVEQTIGIFLETFRDDKNVGLILKTSGFSAGTWDKINCIEHIHEIRSRMHFNVNDGPNIYLIHGTVAEEDMARLYHNAHVFILPTLGEAWGLPLMEASMSGLPVITTGGSGATTFLNPEYSMLLKYKHAKIPSRMHWPHVYEPDQEVTIPDWGEFATLLKCAKESYSTLKENALKQRDEIIERKLSWKETVDNLIVQVQDLGGFD